VDAAQKRQLAIMERLDADAQPVDAEGPKRGKRFPGNGAGIDLECGLGFGGDVEGFAQVGEDSLDLARCEERRRSAAEVDRLIRSRVETVSLQEDLAPQCRKEVFNGFGIRYRIEVAIDALALTERDMDV
jgi:hypothetical protein